MSRRVPPSRHCGSVWLVEELRATLAVPTTVEVARSEEAWRAGRPADKRDWDWRRIVRTHRDYYALRDGETTCALWAGMAVPARSGYALQYLEVAPQLRGRRVWGRLALLTVLARAEELGLRQVALRAPQERAPWYRRMGALDGAPGWASDGKLVLLRFEGATIANAVLDLDGRCERQPDA